VKAALAAPSSGTGAQSACRLRQPATAARDAGLRAELQAIKNIVRDPAKFGFELPAIRNEPYSRRAQDSRHRHRDGGPAGRNAGRGLPRAESVVQSPSHRRAGAANLLLPADRAETFLANLAAFESTGQPLASWTTYTVQNTDTVENIAKRVGSAPNTCARRTEFRAAPAGGRLDDPDPARRDDDRRHRADAAGRRRAAAAELSAQRVITYRVRRGDHAGRRCPPLWREHGRDRRTQQAAQPQSVCWPAAERLGRAGCAGTAVQPAK